MHSSMSFSILSSMQKLSAMVIHALSLFGNSYDVDKDQTLIYPHYIKAKIGWIWSLCDEKILDVHMWRSAVSRYCTETLIR